MTSTSIFSHLLLTLARYPRYGLLLTKSRVVIKRQIGSLYTHCKPISLRIASFSSPSKASLSLSMSNITTSAAVPGDDDDDDNDGDDDDDDDDDDNDDDDDDDDDDNDDDTSTTTTAYDDNSFSPPESLELSKRNRPLSRDDEIYYREKAVTCNKADLKTLWVTRRLVFDELFASLELPESDRGQQQLEETEQDLAALKKRIAQLESENDIHEEVVRKLKCIKETFPFALSNYLWKEPKSSPNVSMFPLNSFGSYILDRKRVIDNILTQVSRESTIGVLSIYMHGCAGLGKTSILHLLAKSLKSEGYEVYHFSGPLKFPGNAHFEMRNFFENNPSSKFAFLVEGVSAQYDCGLMMVLLESNSPNLVVIGTGTEDYIDLDISANFYEKFSFPDLAIKVTDEDYIKLVERLGGDNPALVSDICAYILNYCGGHVFPTLYLIEYFVAGPSEKRVRFDNFDDFVQYFNGPEFPKTSQFATIERTCFNLKRSNVSMHVLNFLNGKGSTDDYYKLMRVGLWNTETRQVISPLVTKLCQVYAIAGEEGKR